MNPWERAVLTGYLLLMGGIWALARWAGRQLDPRGWSDT